MKILNFGSLNIDYVYGVSHFVEKGETISSDTLQVFAGGKGLNQSIALSRAGADVYHAGVIGTDGSFLGEILCEAEVDTRYLKISQEIRTGNAVIQKDREGDNCIILYGGANQAVTKDQVDMVLEDFQKGDCLILQNEISEIPYLVEKAHDRGMQTVLNPSPMNEKIFEINLDFIDCFILNEVEARALLQSDGDSKDLLKKLNERFPHAEIVLTLGEKGSIYAGAQGMIEQSAYKVDTVDNTAGGGNLSGEA
nr:PfkB family carbohydrate kinase [uncultured Anaerostipes sp.]